MKACAIRAFCIIMELLSGLMRCFGADWHALCLNGSPSGKSAAAQCSYVKSDSLYQKKLRQAEGLHKAQGYNKRRGLLWKTSTAL